MTNNSEHNTIRTPKELSLLAKAAMIGDMCFDYILSVIQPGVTEIYLAKKIDEYLLTHGGEGLAFPTICVSGINSNQPHGEPTDKKLEDGDFLTMDFGTVVGGICGDMTRTVAIGRVNKEQTKVYNTVLDAQIAGLEKVKAGVRCFDVDRTCRDIIENAGYGEYFVHGTGHGVGKEVHEPPTLNKKSEEVLKAGEAVTIEPGIYIPEKYGVRIEDLAIVTDFGIINLVHSSKELIII